MPSFIYAACNPGWEPALKREMQARFGEAVVPAFLRPGLVTWKCHREITDAEMSPLPVFARLFGRSLGMAPTLEALPALLDTVPEMPVLVSPRVFPEDGFDLPQWKAFDEIRAAVTAKLAESHRVTSEPVRGSAVIDLITGDPGEAIFAGIRHHDGVHRGVPRIVLPESVPSRAWLKMEQALAFAGLSDLAGFTVLELGCAPGGASLSLLNRGARVIGVDTADMDPAISDESRFTHWAVSAGEVPLTSLPRPIDLLVSDMNLAPPVALRYVGRLQRKVRARFLFLTLKINDARMEASTPAFVDQVGKMVPRYECIATQLPANRSEITILAWDPRRRMHPLWSSTEPS